MSVALPFYLLGLAALALPWLLHRFGQQRAEQLDFASDRFLEAVPPPVSQRHRLRYRTLFALRCLALLALCLLFARPWLPFGEPDGAPRTLHAVVLDSSLSMRADERFERARDALADRLAALPVEDRVRLFAFGARLRAIGDEPVPPDEARAALAALEPGYARGDFGELMRGLDAAGSRSDLPVAAIVATDLQRSALPLRRNDLFAPSLAGLELIDVSDGAGQVNVRVDASASTADRATARLQVEVAAAGATQPLAGTLIIEHDGDTLHSEPVTLSANRPWRRTFEALTLPASPADALTVRIVGESADALPEDDEQRIALRRERPFRVSLAAVGARLPDRTRVFLETAFEGDGSVEVQRASGGAQRLPDETDLAVVVIEPDDAEALATVREEVRRGTDVLVIPAAAGQDGAPTGIDAMSPDRRGIPIGRVAQAHPLGPDRIDWFGVRRYAPVRFAAEDDDRVLVAGEDGAALLIERAVSGGGRLLVLDDPLDGETSNLPFEPAFVELLDAARRWADSDGALPERIDSGTPLSLPDGVQVFGPQGDALRSLDQRGRAERLLLDAPGLYRVLDARGERIIEVVTDARESALQAVDGAVRDAWQTRHGEEAVQALDGDVSTAQAADEVAQEVAAALERDRLRTQRTDQRWLLMWLLPLLVVIVLGESLLGNRRLDVRRDG